MVNDKRKEAGAAAPASSRPTHGERPCRTGPTQPVLRLRPLTPRQYRPSCQVTSDCGVEPRGAPQGLTIVM